MKALIVPLAALALLGCASSDCGRHDLGLLGGATPGAREALQQQVDSSNCRAKAHRETTRLADMADVSPANVAFVAVEGPEQFAQLDDPTRDWTTDQATGSPGRCPPTGRKHRYFA